MLCFYFMCVVNEPNTQRLYMVIVVAELELFSIRLLVVVLR